MRPDDIRTLRQSLGLSQEDLASQIGVSFATVNRWEQGRALPREANRRTLERLAKGSTASSEQHRIFETPTYRPIQYLGSKLRLVPQLSAAIHRLVPAGSTVCDLFSGSGVVSHALANQYRVIALDIQKYSQILASASLAQGASSVSSSLKLLRRSSTSEYSRALYASFQPIIDLEVDVLDKAEQGHPQALAAFTDHSSFLSFCEHGVADGAPSDLQATLQETRSRLDVLRLSTPPICSTYYGGVYFSYEQAVAIDAALHELPKESSTTDDIVCLALLLSTASWITNTVGKQFAQPMRLVDRNGQLKKLMIERTLRDRRYDIPSVFRKMATQLRAARLTSAYSHDAICGDYRAFLTDDNQGVDCFYADPPYTIDHYSRFYHVLETLALRDQPQIARMKRPSGMRIMRGLYRTDRHQSPFCIPSQVEQAFCDLFEGVSRHRAPLVLSYSPFNSANSERPRLMNLKALLQLARTYFKSVELERVDDHRHRRFHSTRKNLKPIEDAEALIVCKPN